eukprot:jgi/Tetstr1/464088/TSEL_008893.t1
MMKPWMLLVSMLLIGGAVFAVIVYKKHFAGDGDEESGEEGFKSEGGKRKGGRRGRRERFETEGDGTDGADGDEIVEVADAYRRLKGGSPSTSDVRRVMRTMRVSGDSASDVIMRELKADEGLESDTDEDEPIEAAMPLPPPPQPRQQPKPKQQQQQQQQQPKQQKQQRQQQQEPKQQQPMMDAMDASMLRRVEDELEGVVNRIDGLLEEIQAMKGRQVSGPLSDETVESFVPYHPV